MGRETPRKDSGRSIRANVPVTEVKGKNVGTQGSSGEGKQDEQSFGMSAPRPGPGGGKVKSEGRLL